jgi:mycofactocin system glycosyltransferase
VQLDAAAQFVDREVVSGGSPWRLLRLPGISASTAERWRDGGVVGVGEGTFARTLVQQGLLHPDYDDGPSLDELDVVIPVRDDLVHVTKLLNDLRGFNVVVVDDGSVDPNSLSEVAQRSGARVIRRAHSAGPALARNEGAHVTWRPYIWFVDADVSIPDASVLARALLRHFNDPLVAAVAPRVQGASGPSRRDAFERVHSPLDLGPLSSLVVPRGRVSYVPSASLIVRRSAFGEGFDASLRVGEDVDFVWRLHDEGWLVRYDARHVVHHVARPTWRAWFAQRHGYGRSASALAERHPDRLEPVRVDATTMGAWIAVAAGQPRFALALTSLARQRLRAQLPSTVENADLVANRVVLGGIARSGAPLARAVVRSYLPLILVLAIHPKSRRAALGVLAAGTLSRWHDVRDIRARDVPLALADDAAYSSGVWRGAISARSWLALRPRITGTTDGLRALVGAKKKSPPPGH